MNINFSGRKQIKCSCFLWESNLYCRKVSLLFITKKSWLCVTIKETVFAEEFLRSRNKTREYITFWTHTDTACAVGRWWLRILATAAKTTRPASLDIHYLIDIRTFTFAIPCASRGCNISLRVSFTHWDQPFKIASKYLYFLFLFKG